MNTLKNKILVILFGIIFSLSSSILSFQLIVQNYYTKINILFTCFISFVCALLYFKKSYKSAIKNFKQNYLLSILYILLILIVFRKLYFTKAVLLKSTFNVWIINPFRLRYFILSLFSMLYLGVNICYKIKSLIIDFYNTLDLWDKKAYILTSVISVFLIIILYNINQNWYIQYDKVYSMDSGFVFNDIIPLSTYYDIRHPLLSVITFPVYAIVSSIIHFLLPGNLYTTTIAIIFQIINSQLLIIVGLYLKEMTKNKMVFIIYMISFPTILYTLFLEKFQICIFFLVLYVFKMCTKKEQSIPSLIASVGTILTSAVIGISELLVSDSLKNKMKKIFTIILLTLLTLICLGRAHILVHGISEIKDKSFFTNHSLTVGQNFISTTKMIQNSIIALPSITLVEKNEYMWDNLYTKISIIALLINLIIIIGIVVNKNNIFVKITSSWYLFAFILFMVFKWSIHTSPLFSIYFSWTIIPLFVYGMDFIIKKIKLNYKIVYGLIIFFMIVINIATIIDIANFLNQL